ncbi:MAG: acyltransferase, partial [Eubacterium sp.]|nr:acyltransferase [Eubacterium sp.]
MLMIPVLHILGHGGLLDGAELLSVKYDLVWLLEAAAFCAVNCYALISGYVCYGGKHRYTNLMMIYLQVFFYIASVSILYAVLRPDKLDIIDAAKQAFFSFALGPYWYFRAYFCMFFFIPFLNLILDKFEKKNMQKFLLAIFLVCSLLPTVFRTDIAKLDRGYCFLWLAILYLFGAYIRKYGLWDNMKNWKNLLGYFLCVIVSWGAKIIIDSVQNHFSLKLKDGNFLIRYTSPTIVLCAVFLLMFFLKLNIKPGMCKFIKFFAPASFGVYLLHEEPLIRDKLITGTFVGYLNMPAWL